MRFLLLSALALPALAQTAHFHHLHLNSTDPAAAMEFYAAKFDCEKARFAGTMDGIWAQKSWLLFNKVSEAPPWELVSAIWHFGWGAEDMKATYQKQLDMGTKFFTPLTDISRLANFPGFYYAYVLGPDHALIELNTANHHHFGHLHLFSQDPIAAGEWYMKYFGATRRGNRPISREPRFYEKYQVGPSMSLMMDNVNIIIFPYEHARQAYPEQWKGRTSLESTQGHVVDHVAFRVDNLQQALERMRHDGVKVTGEVATLAGNIKSAFVEGPDRIRIELVEEPAAQAKTVPDYVHGDECLFCHRNDIGPGWQQNAHGVTVRQREDAPELLRKLQPPAEVEYFLGSRHQVRFLKKEGYGKFAIRVDGAWDKTKFADRCAGCHTTGVDPATRAFSAFGLDCYTCHGVVNLEHSKDTSLIWLSKKRRGDAQAVTSICAQCHLRGGRSRATGLPYANVFVPGENLFQDYEVDLAKADDESLNPGDRHVLQNVRDVVEHGSDTTCLSCHQVHAHSTRKHRLVLTGPICLDCHNAQGPKKDIKTYTVHSALCEY